MADGFARHLDQLKRGSREPYPFYAALLYNDEPGLDAELHTWVSQNWRELDEMTLKGGLVFAFPEWANPAPVYGIAHELQIQPKHLPCAVIFTDPARTMDRSIIKQERSQPGAHELQLPLVFRAPPRPVHASVASSIQRVPAHRGARLARSDVRPACDPSFTRGRRAATSSSDALIMPQV